MIDTKFLSSSVLFTNCRILGFPDANCLLLKDGTIQFIGEFGHFPASTNSSVVNLEGALITPGLTNAHTHVAMTLFRDLAHSYSDMIDRLFFPVENLLKKEWIAGLCYPALLSALRSGTTTIFDHYYFSEEIGVALEKIGMRGLIGETLADIGGAKPNRDGIKEWKKTVANWRFSSRIKPSVCPHASNTVSDSYAKEISEFAESEKLPLHFHLSQTESERQKKIQISGVTPVKWALNHGWLTERSLAVHLVSADINDLQILKDTSTKVALCPVSQILYENLAPIEDFFGLGLTGLIGTDCSASNDSFEIKPELRMLSLLLKDRGLNITTDEVLKTTFENPAKFYGDPSIGKLLVGKTRDFVIWPNSLEFRPVHNLTSNFLFSQSSSAAKHVMIDGRWVLFNGEPVLLSKGEMTEEFESSYKSFAKNYSPPNPELSFEWKER